MFTRMMIVLFALLLGACTTAKKAPVETFEEMCREVRATYGGFTIRDIDWDESCERYRPRVTDEMSDEDFYQVLTEILAETDDGHVHLIAPGKQEWSANRYYRDRIGFERFSLDLIRDEYLGGDFESGEYDEYTLGTLEDGATYLHLPGIWDNVKSMRKARELAEKSGRLVFDLRHNGGGDMTWFFTEVRDWSSRDVDVLRSRTRNGPDLNDFTDWYTWKIEGRGTDIDFEMAVLIDRFTISAGERAVLGLKALGVRAFIGEPTNGSVATTVGRELLNGWYITVATQEIFNLDSSTIEGVGQMPDIYLENDVEDMEQGIDAVLDTAMIELSKP